MNRASLSTDRDGREPVFDAPYTVALGLEAGDEIPPHRHAGEDVLFVLFEGTLTLTVGEETETLTSGEMVAFDGDQDIAVSADEDSRALVVFADQ